MFLHKSFKSASFSLKSFRASVGEIVAAVRQFTVFSVTKVSGKASSIRALAARQRDRFSFSSSDRHIIRR